MLSSSEDKAIELLQLLPTLSNYIPPYPVSYIALCSIYRISNKVLHIELHILVQIVLTVENIMVVDNFTDYATIVYYLSISPFYVRHLVIF